MEGPHTVSNRLAIARVMYFVSLAYIKQEKIGFAALPYILRANIGKAGTCHIKFRRSYYGRGNEAAIVALLADVSLC
jgi:hypothetical protein